jgi:hypothetical protein
VGAGFQRANEGQKCRNAPITRGKLSTFSSSSIAERGFSASCGTPLTYRSIPGGFVTVTLGSLDDPNAFAPHTQYGAESRVTWLAEAINSPETALSDWFERKGGCGTAN